MRISRPTLNAAGMAMLALVLAGCASEPSARQAAGPSATELAAMLAATGEAGVPASHIAHLNCTEVSAAPGEYPCSWKQERATGSWHLRSAVVARKGQNWIFIDGPDEQF